MQNAMPAVFNAHINAGVNNNRKPGNNSHNANADEHPTRYDRLLTDKVEKLVRDSCSEMIKKKGDELCCLLQSRRNHSSIVLKWVGGVS